MVLSADQYPYGQKHRNWLSHFRLLLLTDITDVCIYTEEWKNHDMACNVYVQHTALYRTMF